MLPGRRYLCKAKVLSHGKDGTDGHTPVFSLKNKTKNKKKPNKQIKTNPKQRTNKKSILFFSEAGRIYTTT